MTEEHPLAAYVRESYEPRFDRLGTVRRVLGYVTDEDHLGRGPRNTVDRLEYELSQDPDTNLDAVSVAECVERLLVAGLLEQRDDETLAVTEAGLVELVN